MCARVRLSSIVPLSFLHTSATFTHSRTLTTVADTKNVYFYDRETGASQWEDPFGTNGQWEEEAAGQEGESTVSEEAVNHFCALTGSKNKEVTKMVIVLVFSLILSLLLFNLTLSLRKDAHC